MALTPKQEAELEERAAKQLFFNMIVGKMRKQGKPGMHGRVLGLRCPDGSRCSLGWLITDKFYQAYFETRCPNEVLIDILKMPNLGYQFYDDLQEAHDQSARASDWWPAFQQQMTRLATKHVLNPSSLTQAPVSA